MKFAEERLKLFAISNQLAENDLDRVERELRGRPRSRAPPHGAR